MGPLSTLLARYLPNKIPGYTEYVQHSGIRDITPSRLAKAGLQSLRSPEESWGPHAVFDNRLKEHSKKYGYTLPVKAARSMISARDYGRRNPDLDPQLMKDQAVLYQYLQGLKGFNFEGDLVDALYNKYGIDQAVAEKGSIPAPDEMDFQSIEDLFDEFNRMMVGQ
jgi:hypothetical protein